MTDPVDDQEAVDAAIARLSADGVADPERYRWVLEAIPYWGWPASYLDEATGWMTWLARKHGETT
jgi:hypothetical protein